MISVNNHIRRLKAFIRHPVLFTRASLKYAVRGKVTVYHSINEQGEFVAAALAGYLSLSEERALKKALSSPLLDRYFVFIPELKATDRADHVMTTCFPWEEWADIRAAIRAKSPLLLSLVFTAHGISFPFNDSPSRIVAKNEAQP